MSSVYTSFVQACADCDLRCVQKLYEQVRDVNCSANVLMNGAKRLSPLDAAISNNCFALVKWLIDVANADVNISLADGATPLSRAASMQRLQVIQYLLCHRATNPNFVGQNGVPALHVAALGAFPLGDGTCALKMIVEDSRADVNVPDQHGKTALMLISECGKFNVCEYLLQHNADVNKSNASGETALSLAAQRGYDDIAFRLLQAGANPNALLLNDVQGSMLRRNFIVSLSRFFPHLFVQSEKRQSRDAPDYGFQWRNAVTSFDICRVFSKASFIEHLAPLLIRARLISYTRLFRLHIASRECRIFALKWVSPLSGRAFFKDVLVFLVQLCINTEPERNEWQNYFSEDEKYNLIDLTLMLS